MSQKTESVLQKWSLNKDFRINKCRFLEKQLNCYYLLNDNCLNDTV